MALLDIFKKGKSAKGPQERTIRRARQNADLLAGKKPEAMKEIKKEEPASVKTTAGKSALTYRILKSPRITEKATDLGDLNQYTFEVWKSANKTEIKKAVQNLYGVDAISVKIINIPRKARVSKGKIGWASGIKKAVVRIKSGQKIEVLPR